MWWKSYTNESLKNHIKVVSQCEHQTLTKVSQATLCEYKASQKGDVKKHIESVQEKKMFRQYRENEVDIMIVISVNIQLYTETPLSLPLQ